MSAILVDCRECIWFQDAKVIYVCRKLEREIDPDSENPCLWFVSEEDRIIERNW